METLHGCLQRSHGLRAIARVWSAGPLLLLLVGCAAGKPQVTELLWPPPPLTSRIKFVGVLHDQDDLGRSGGDMFMEALVGRKEAPTSLRQPMAAVPSRDGKRLYVSDYSRQGVFVFEFEERRVWFLGGPTLPFKRPFGIAVDETDNVYVVDSDQRLIRVFDPSGKFLGEITHESVERPTGIAIDSSRRRIYVADSASKSSGNHVIHVFDMDGAHLSAFGGLGVKEGKLYFPTYLAVDEKGILYVADTINSRVQAFNPDGQYLRTFGQRGDTFGGFARPKGVALDSFGNLYVVDSTWSNVQIFNQKRQVLLYFAGWGRIPGLLNNPTGIAIGKDNRIYVADAFNGRVAIYQLINTTAEDSFAQPPRPEKGGDAAKGKKKESEKKEAVRKTEKQDNPK